MTSNLKFKNSEKLFDDALKIIPLASQTFSKSSMNFPRGISPLFFEKGDGAYVYDVDNNKYIDFLLGLLPIILGYKDPDVNLSIINQLEKGITFSLPTDLEYRLARILCEMIPGAEMVRFAKNGSDVTSAAIRLSRAHNGKNMIAVCGYHGWHDWYIGTTSMKKGIPDESIKLTKTFEYNNIDSLKAIIDRHPNDVSAVILEPVTFVPPNKGFLEDIRSLCTENDIVLIFDEIISGFRIDLGGAQKKFGVTPDLSTFGKSMSNGMPLSALVGKKELMQKVNEIFFSGTFGGETLSLAASIATLKKLKKIDAPKIFNETGKVYKENINNSILNYGLEELLSVSGMNWWPKININSSSSISQMELNTLLRQELISKGVFISSTINLSASNCSNKIVNDALNIFDDSIKNISSYLKSSNPRKYLKGELIQPVFTTRK